MNQTLLFRRIKRHCNETRPLHVFLNDQTLVCFTPQTFKFFPDISLAPLSEYLKAKAFAANIKNIPVLSPDKADKGLVTLNNQSSIRHPSAFLKLIIETSKPSSVSMVRWLAQEILPKTVSSKIPYAAVTDDTDLLNMIGRHDHRKKGQMLIDLAVIRVGSSSLSESHIHKKTIKERGEDV